MPRGSGGMSMTHQALALEAPATGCGFAGAHFAVSDGDGNVHLCATDGTVSSRSVHKGAVLGLATNPKTGSVYSAGDDGNVFALQADAEPVALHTGRKWVDTIAASARGHVAWSAGKTIFLLKQGSDSAVELTAPSSVSGLCFSPDGKWLGAAVYGGAFLAQVADPATTKMLEWAGSHITIGFSPDGRFCVTSMLENALHVWRIDKPAEKHGRMGGYPTKPLSFDWTADARFLATAGADVLVLWPFTGGDGPIGQQAGVFGNPEQQVVSRSVASRPQSMQLAIGYADGSVMLYDRKSQEFVPVAGPHDAGPVIDIRFTPDGKRMGFIREAGGAGLVAL